MHSLVGTAAMSCAASTSGGPQAATHIAKQVVTVFRQQHQSLPWTPVAASVAAAAGSDALQQRCSLVAARAASRSLVVKAAAREGEAQEDEGTQEEEWVEIGKIGPPHGVRGEMKVQPLTDFPEDRLGEPGPRWVQCRSRTRMTSY